MYSKPTLNLFTNKSLYYLTFLFLFVCCGKKENGEPSASLASGLTYNPAQLELQMGVVGSSVKPTVNGTSPIAYSLTTSPASNGITIDGQGTIKADATLTAGEYNITVNATNAAGTSTFPAVYKIKVTPSPTLPSALTYNPNTLTMEAGEDKFSVVPTINGSTPVTFSVISSPVTSAITIDNTGKLHATSGLTAGTYTLSVTATNAVGSFKFDNIYTTTVNPSTGPINLTYSPASLIATQGTAATSATPTITSASAVTYTISTVPANPNITINSQGAITASNTVTAGTYAVSVTATNAAGSKAFANIYSITVNSPSTAVTFTKNIQAIILDNCNSCHVNGVQTKYNVYSNAKSNIDLILDRIKRAQGAAGMMPYQGTRLPQATIDLIQQWKDDGLKE
ncbi:MAG: hypothetical protein JWN56_87 [Sphingobacteriales bacterium]|nr:hypothetical protein [Sphingobacteriales bacterium]